MKKFILTYPKTSLAMGAVLLSLLLVQIVTTYYRDDIGSWLFSVMQGEVDKELVPGVRFVKDNATTAHLLDDSGEYILPGLIIEMGSDSSSYIIHTRPDAGAGDRALEYCIIDRSGNRANVKCYTALDFEAIRAEDESLRKIVLLPIE